MHDSPHDEGPLANHVPEIGAELGLGSQRSHLIYVSELPRMPAYIRLSFPFTFPPSAVRSGRPLVTNTLRT